MVTVISIDYTGGKDYWLTRLQVKASDNEISSTLVPSEDIRSISTGSQILLMSGDWDLKRKYEQRVSLLRLLSANHAYLLLFAPIWLIALLIRYLARRLRA